MRAMSEPAMKNKTRTERRIRACVSSRVVSLGNGCVGISETAFTNISSASSFESGSLSVFARFFNGSLTGSVGVTASLVSFSSTCMVASPLVEAALLPPLLRLLLLLVGRDKLCTVVEKHNDRVSNMDVQIRFPVSISVFKRKRYRGQLLPIAK